MKKINCLFENLFLTKFNWFAATTLFLQRPLLPKTIFYLWASDINSGPRTLSTPESQQLPQKANFSSKCFSNCHIFKIKCRNATTAQSRKRTGKASFSFWCRVYIIILFLFLLCWTDTHINQLSDTSPQGVAVFNGRTIFSGDPNKAHY